MNSDVTPEKRFMFRVDILPKKKMIYVPSDSFGHSQF